MCLNMLQGTCREGLKTQMRNFDKCQMKKNPFLFTIFTCKMIHVANTSFKAVMFWSASEIYTRSIADIVLVNYTKEQIMEIMVSLLVSTTQKHKVTQWGRSSWPHEWHTSNILQKTFNQNKKSKQKRNHALLLKARQHEDFHSLYP